MHVKHYMTYMLKFPLIITSSININSKLYCCGWNFNSRKEMTYIYYYIGMHTLIIKHKYKIT